MSRLPEQVLRRDFPDREALAAAQADAVADDLARGIAARGTASLALSGGTTPALFLSELSRRGLDWGSVVVTLVDERWVDETSDRSNARLVRRNLLVGPAAAARFVPLYSGGPQPDAEAVARTNAELSAVPMPFDAATLGMGSDGHTASYFPGGDTLAEALAGEGPAVSLRAPAAGEPRITLTLPRLLASRALHFHIEGEKKAAVLAEALAPGPVEDMPVRAVLEQRQVPLTIYWCP